MNNPTLSRTLTASLITGAAVAAASHANALALLPSTDPLLKFNFQDAGSGEPNLGTLGSAGDITYAGSAGWNQSEENRPIGSVVTSRVYRQTGGTLSGTGPRVLPGNADTDALDELESFTIAGWVWTNGGDIGGPNGARFYRDSDGSNGIDLRGSGAQSLQLQVDSYNYNVGGVYTSSTSPSSDTTGWFFFAVTWDGSLPSQPASYYIGRPGEASGVVTLLGTDTLSDAVTDLGKTNANSAKPSIFNTSDGARAMNGWLDDFAFWGVGSGGAGALTLNELEGYRRDTLGFVVPEPATGAMMGVGMVAGLCRRRRG